MKNEANTESLKLTFDNWAESLNAGNLDKFFSYFDEDSETLDEDYP